MTSVIAGELRQAFELVLTRRDAERLASPQQAAHYKEIVTEAETARQAGRRAFVEDHGARVDAAQRTIIDKAGEKSRHLVPPWAQHDRFDQNATRAQAVRDVAAAHERCLKRIDDTERSKLNDLLSGAARDNGVRGNVVSIAPHQKNGPNDTPGPKR